MRNPIIILAGVFFILILITLGIYFFIEKPKQDNINSIATNNVSLKFLNNDKQVITGYVVVLDNNNNIYSSGISTLDNYVYIMIPKNHTFTIYSNNSLDTNYYTSYKDFNYFNGDVINSEIIVDKYGELNISHDKFLSESKNITLTLNSTGLIKCLNFCVRGSTHIVSIRSQVEEMKKPTRLKDKVDKCFKLGYDLNNNQTDIAISYSSFGELRDDDFINIYFIDGDISFNNRYCNYEDSAGNDIGKKDILYQIPFK